MLGPDGRVTLDDLDNAPLQLPNDGAHVSQDQYEELRLQFVAISDEKLKLQLEFDSLKTANRASEILDGLIEPFAGRTFNFMCCYCGFVGFMLWFNAIGVFKTPISDAVMQILVGSTAATVIGLVGMVLTGIFVGARKKSGG